MEQDILVTDVTAMREGRVCIAGITREWENIRPHLPFPGIYAKHLFRNKKIIVRPRAIIRMQLTPERNRKPPHMEDYRWSEPETVHFIRLLPEADWYRNLQRISLDYVGTSFGVELDSNRRVKPEEATVSLTTVRCRQLLEFNYAIDEWRSGEFRFRLSFVDARNEIFQDIPVTDLSLQTYAHHLRIQLGLSVSSVSSLIRQKLENTERIWLRLGLTRPFRAREDERSELWCYLQVNGIYTLPDYLEGKCFADFTE